MAGLRCDGTPRDSDDDLHCTFFEESDQDDLFSENHDCSEKNKILKSLTSPTSQDTETDVNLDLESVSKEDDESLIKRINCL